MNKKFNREVLKLLPNLREAQTHFFYEVPFDHVLAGFAWEAPPSGLYIWRYAFPLFEVTDFMHLGYGERLPVPNDYIGMGNSSERALAAEFINQISPYREEVSQLRELSSFISHLQSAPLDNPLIRRGLALAFVIKGEPALATEQLQISIRSAHDQEFEESAKEWMAAISNGSARDMLLASERQLKRRLGITD